MFAHSAIIFSRNASTCVRLLSTTASPGALHQKSVVIRTCKNVYSGFGERKPFLFRKCPSSGIDIKVLYVDSLPSTSYNAPVVMAVHGTPGSYQDFEPMLSSLSSKGFRVIAANMPGFEFTNETQTFRHTTEEKAEYLSDWLQEIGVNRVDVAMMHSSACYPTLELWRQRQELIKSLVIMNPPGHRTIKAMKPEWYTAFAARINTHPLGKKVFKAMGGTRVFRGVRNDARNAENAILACQTMFYAKNARIIDLMENIRTSRTPSLYFYSEKDKLVDTAIFHEMLAFLGADESGVTHLSKDGSLLQEAIRNSDWLRVLSVRDGGHYAFRSCAEVLEKEITKLLAQVYMTDVLRPVANGNESEEWQFVSH